MKPLAILKKARRLLANPSRWIKLAPAEDRYGFRVLPTDPNATCFCATGAILARCDDPETAGEAISLLARNIRGFKTTDSPAEIHVQCWNDNRRRTHAQVLKAFDKTIALVEGGAK